MVNQRTKLLLVIQPIDGGSALHVNQLISHLDKKKFDIHLAAPYCKVYDSICEKNNATFHPIPYKRSMNILADLGPFVSLIKLMRKNKFDVIHLHSTKAGLVGRVAAWLCRTPKVIYTPHGLLYIQTSSPIKKRILFWAERITMWMVDSIIFVSKAELDRALRDGLVKKDKAVVITNGVELPKKIPSMPENNVVVLVGRLAEPKKPEDLIKAAPLVLKEVTDASFVLVGDGPKQDDLMKLAKKLAVDQKVEFVGFQSDVGGWLSNSKIATICSASEGLPYVVLEAMAYGRPIVGSRVGGIPNLIEDGVNGYTYEAGDHEDLAGRLIELLLEHDKLSKYGQNGRLFVEDSYSIATMTNKLGRMYIR